MRPDFSKLSSIYDALGSVAFCGALRRSQNYFLGELPRVENVLILGGGTGTFLVDLLKTGKVSSVDYVDVSPGMISRAKKKVRKAGFEECVNFVCGTEDDLPDKKYDLICTNYFLDCFNDVELSSVLIKIKERLIGEGLLLCTDFYLNEKSSFQEKGLVKFLYLFFRTTCGLKVQQLPDFDDKLKIMKTENEKFFFFGLLRAALYRN